MKRFLFVLMVFGMVSGVILWTGTEPVLAKSDRAANQISPDSPFYFLDRAVEEVIVVFLPEAKKAEFRMQTSRERFEEAVVMQNQGKSEKASKLFKEGLGDIGKVFKSWKRCLEKDIDMSGLKADLKFVLGEAKKTFTTLKNEITPDKVADFFKELAELTKIQIEVMLK